MAAGRFNKFNRQQLTKLNKASTLTVPYFFGVYVPPGAGSLSGSSTTDNINLTVDISAQSFNDWAIVNHTMLSSGGPSTITNRKSGSTSSIGLSGAVNNYGTSTPASTITWSDGGTSASGSSTGGSYTMQSDAATITLTFPADTSLRRAVIYYGNYRYDAINPSKISASLSDASASSLAFDGVSPSVSNTVEHGYLIFDYKAGSSGQTLTVTIKAQVGTGPWDNVSIQAAGWKYIAGTTYPGYVKVWNGSSWTYKPVKVWNGSSWIQKPVKFRGASTWTTTNGT